jgi:DNA-binding transcriptional regulator YdaS (Cro superfamily)
MKVELKVGILSKFGSQVRAARRLNIRESRLSYIIHGHVEPAAAELSALRRELGDELVDRAFRRDETLPAA